MTWLGCNWNRIPVLAAIASTLALLALIVLLVTQPHQGTASGSLIALVKPPAIVAQAQSSSNSSDNVTLVSWVLTNQTINLEDANESLTENGFLVTEVTDEYLEANKRYDCLPGFYTGINAPGVTVNVRVYSNGTILAYVVLDPSQLPLITYFPRGAKKPGLLTGKVLNDVLSYLGLGEYAQYIKHSMPSHPDAKYIGFMWAHNDWMGFDVSGTYKINKEVIAAGYILLINSYDDQRDYGVSLYLDGERVAYVADKWYYCSSGCKDDVYGILDNKYFTQGSHSIGMSHGDDYGFFVVVMVFKS